MEIALLIIGVLGLIPVLLLINAKCKKRYKFDLDYKQITFASLIVKQNAKLDKHCCLIVYVMRIINNSDKSNTLKNVILSYRFDGKIYQDESYIVPTEMIPKAEKAALVLSNGLDKICLMGWDNIRTKLGKCETLQPGGVFSGSAIFLFKPHIKDVRCIKDIKLIVTNFNEEKSSYPINIIEEWYDILDKGFFVIN